MCLKPYTEEMVTSGEGLGTASKPVTSATLDSVAEVDEQEEEEEGKEKEAEVVEEEGGMGAEDGIVMEGCYMAVAQDFKARRPDEMDVKERDVVCVLDDSQAGDDEGDGVVWEHISNHVLVHFHPDTWYVCLGEKEGWLPVSILVPINEKLETAGN